MNPRRNGRDGSACDLGNFRERQFFLETQEKRFPVDWLQGRQSGRDSFGIFASCGREERRFEIRRGKIHARFVLPAHPMRCRLLLSQVVDRQVSCDGEQPRLETEAAVILPRVFQNTQPGFLNEVLGQFTPGCPVDQISEEPIVILRDDSANEFGVSSPQCARDALRLGFRHTRKGSHHGNHTPIYEVWRRNYAWPHIPEEAQRLSNAPYRGVVAVEEVPWGRRLPPARPLAHS